LSLVELTKTLLSKKEKCLTKKDKIKFVKLVFTFVQWTLENFTVDLTLEYLQAIQYIKSMNVDLQFNQSCKLLILLLSKINTEEH
jgi:hypothetical protein